jgi:sigma-B regulation protein RsbU (phosphoserine phosphatase)
MYCNAGHNPPYLFRVQNGQDVQELIRTGMPLGITDDENWEQACVQMAPGDVLVLYTDGVTEARNVQGEFYGERRLLESLRADLQRPARDIQQAVISDTNRFVGDAPQSDDIALAVIVRDKTA